MQESNIESAPDTNPAMNLTRRRAMRVMAGATGAAAVGVGADRASLQPVGEADALAPAIVAGAAVAAGASVAAGWLLREHEVIGADDPPEGLTADALQSRVYQTIRTRKSTNGATITNNQNIIESGLQNTLYVDGKLAAIEALNAGKSQAEVETAAIDAMEEYAATIQSEFLKVWNESVNELEMLSTSMQNHSDITVEGTLRYFYDYNGNTIRRPTNTFGTGSMTLVDGSTVDLRQVGFNDKGPYAFNSGNSNANNTKIQMNYDGDSVMYMYFTEWNSVWTEIENVISNVNDGLITWVDSVYSQVQSGDIEVSDLITPRERAEMMSDDEQYPQAVADLVALNVPVDLERKATLKIPSKNATLVGTVGVTDDSQAMETGTTYSPSAFGTVYFTYDISKGSGDWSEYQTGVDGGTVTFTAEPYADTEFTITTTAGETATVTTSDFSEGTDSNGNAIWTVDISDQVETAITEVESVGFAATVEETQYETVQIQDDFVIEKFEDSDGNTHESASFESSEPQTNENYITEEEWRAMQKKNEELIQKYEDAQNSGGGGGGFLDFGGGGSKLGIVALVAAAAAFLLGGSSGS